mgnify:CR=1 FL=1
MLYNCVPTRTFSNLSEAVHEKNRKCFDIWMLGHERLLHNHDES